MKARKINLTITGCLGRMGQQLIKSANRDKRFIVHNYAAAFEGVDNTINKLVDKKFNDYDFIIYGISPNYFFEYLENDNSLIGSKERKSVL